MNRTFCVVILVPLLLTSCVKNTVTESDLVLENFFSALLQGDYHVMVDMYGGEGLSILADYNGDIDPNDHEKLLELYFTHNGGQIVGINTIVEKTKISEDKYEYKVTHTDQSGAMFLEGEVYTYTLNKIDGSFKVMELPPLIP